MSKFDDSLFLERKSYRKRRLMDLISMLPFFGTFLFFIPLIWVANAELGPRISVAMIYLFGVWIFLSFCQLILINHLKKSDRYEVQKLKELKGD